MLVFPPMIYDIRKTQYGNLTMILNETKAKIIYFLFSGNGSFTLLQKLGEKTILLKKKKETVNTRENYRQIYCNGSEDRILLCEDCHQNLT